MNEHKGSKMRDILVDAHLIYIFNTKCLKISSETCGLKLLYEKCLV